MSGNSLGWIILAFVLYLLMMVVIGAIYSRKNNSTEDYFLGGRSLGGFVAALSAQGKSFVEETRHIDRGYAGLWEVLASLGGRIGREMPPLDAAVKKIPSKKQIYLAFGAKR